MEHAFPVAFSDVLRRLAVHLSCAAGKTWERVQNGVCRSRRPSLLRLLPVSQLQASTSTLLHNSTNYSTWGVVLILAVSALPILALLVSLLTFISRRGRGKWVAIVLTICVLLLRPLYAKLGPGDASDGTNLLLCACAALIATRLWKLSGRRFYAVASVSWGFLAMLSLKVIIDWVLLPSIGHGRGLEPIVAIAPLILQIAATGLIAVSVLQGAVRRGVSVPSLAAFVVYCVALLLLIDGLHLMHEYGLFGNERRYPDPDSDPAGAAIISLIAGAAGGTLAWIYVQRRDHSNLS